MQLIIVVRYWIICKKSPFTAWFCAKVSNGQSFCWGRKCLSVKIKVWVFLIVHLQPLSHCYTFQDRAAVGKTEAWGCHPCEILDTFYTLKINMLFIHPESVFYITFSLPFPRFNNLFTYRYATFVECCQRYMNQKMLIYW